jgi:type VI secretion system protein ImpH
VADPDRRENRTLEAALLKEGHRFSFFQAVRLLEKLRPEAPRVGHQGPADLEAVRLLPSLDLAFPTSDVAGIRKLHESAGGVRYEVTATFLGLYGTVSPLPIYYTEDLLAQDDQSLQREFLDLFHHRLLSLFYRAWEKYRYVVQFSGDGQDFYSRRLLTLLGCDLDRLPPHPHVPLLRLLGLAGLLAQTSHSAATLESALSDYFEGIAVRVEPCELRLLEIPADQHNRLGLANCSLGGDLHLGARVQDRACTFGVEMGPLGLEEFLSFLPPGPRLPEFRELVDLFNSDGLDCVVELVLRESEIPPLRLSDRTSLLGWCSWLGRPSKKNNRVRFLVKGWFHGRD